MKQEEALLPRILSNKASINPKKTMNKLTPFGWRPIGLCAPADPDSQFFSQPSCMNKPIRKAEIDLFSLRFAVICPHYSFCFSRPFILLSTAFRYSVVVTKS